MPKKAAPAAVDYRQKAALLKHASDATRLQVLALLDGKDHNVTELCTALGHQSQPAVSHHLAILRAARIVEPRRSGKNNIYNLTDAGRSLVGAVKSLDVS